MPTRKCQVTLGDEHREQTAQEATFHQFGTDAIYGGDNEPRLITVAIVELKDGTVKKLPPNRVKFLDSPAD